jgi:hypothetical protein
LLVGLVLLLDRRLGHNNGVVVVVAGFGVSTWSLATRTYRMMTPRTGPAVADNEPLLPSRRDVGAQLLASASVLSVMAVTTPSSTSAATAAPTFLRGGDNPNDLAARLAARDAARLPNKLFNLSPPSSPQVYPMWLRGDWRVENTSFAGFLLPSTTIDKAKIVGNPTVAGFQKLSIGNLPDIGKDIPPYDLRIDLVTGWEDRALTYRSLIDAALGYSAVQRVFYNPVQNPNRLSIEFVPYRTINAERIELFCNAREQSNSADDDALSFSCAEYVRQVTFGTGSTVGVPRQVSTNYANFYTYQRTSNDQMSGNGGVIMGNLLTTAYLDPQDPQYFQEPSKPVVVYSHNFQMQRRQ